MYKFIIKGIDGSIKYKDTIGSTNVSSCLNIGRAHHKMKLSMFPTKYCVSDTVEVVFEDVDDSVDVSLTTQNPNHLLVQQY